MTTPKPPALNPVGRPTRANLAPLPALTTHQLAAIRTLAREGVRELSARQVIGLTPSQWKACRADLPDGELSPLALAWAEGLAEGQADIISFMKGRMLKDSSENAAIWLATNVFKLGKQESDEGAQRISIVINAAMSPTDYQRMIEVTAS